MFCLRSLSLLPSALWLHLSTRIIRVARFNSPIWVLIWLPHRCSKFINVFMTIGSELNGMFDQYVCIHCCTATCEMVVICIMWWNLLLSTWNSCWNWTHPLYGVYLLKCVPSVYSFVYWISICNASMKSNHSVFDANFLRILWVLTVMAFQCFADVCYHWLHWVELHKIPFRVQTSKLWRSKSNMNSLIQATRELKWNHTFFFNLTRAEFSMPILFVLFSNVIKSD